jgi:hypothetical protein
VWHTRQVFPCRPRSPSLRAHVWGHRIESQDYSEPTSVRDYSVKPPSNRTSPSRGIRLYRPAARWLVRPPP